MNVLQKGGLEPLTKVPNFKYTFNENRKLFIGYIYPYAEYFINCVTSMPFNSYTYDANCEYIIDNTQNSYNPNSEYKNVENNFEILQEKLAITNNNNNELENTFF